MSAGTSLAEKMELTRDRIRFLGQRFEPGKTAVAWTGGKDSTLVLWFWLEYLQAIGAGQSHRARALNLDTGCKFPEVLAFRDELTESWKVELCVARPAVDEGYPLAEDPVACCRDLKIEPLNRAIQDLGLELLLTGVRSDEHPSRAEREWLESRSTPEHTQAHPILHWTEMDVWAFYMAEDLPYCSLYDQGYRSLGCRPCTQPAAASERAGRETRKEDMLEVLRSLGYF